MRMKTRNILIEGCAVVGAIVILLYFMLPKFLEAQNINDSDHFPDPAFRASIEELMGVKSGEGFSASKAAKKRGTLRCNDKVRDLTGLRYFQAITEIQCWAASFLTNVDFSENPSLISIQLTNSPLTSIDLSKNVNLTVLYCLNLDLTGLDVSHNPKLLELRCEMNRLKTLNLNKNGALRFLYCRENQIDRLDLSKNKELRFLNCDVNLLTELNLSNNPNLDTLSCSDNQLTHLDLSLHPQIKRLYCQNNQIKDILLNISAKPSTIDCSRNKIENMNALFRFDTITYLDIRYNELNEKNWVDVKRFEKRLNDYIDRNPISQKGPRSGTNQIGFFYTPQNNHDPYDFTEAPPDL